MKLPKPFLLILCIAAPLLVGAISGYATASGIGNWYAGLEKPIFNPPNWVFGPVWTVLYILMGISLFLVLTSERSVARTRSLALFWIQLALNFAWSFLFFRFQLIAPALVEIIFLWLAILAMIVFFLRARKTAGYLQIPYLIWVTFASILNAAIWTLN